MCKCASIRESKRHLGQIQLINILVLERFSSNYILQNISFYTQCIFEPSEPVPLDDVLDASTCIGGCLRHRNANKKSVYIHSLRFCGFHVPDAHVFPSRYAATVGCSGHILHSTCECQIGDILNPSFCRAVCIKEWSISATFMYKAKFLSSLEIYEIIRNFILISHLFTIIRICLSHVLWRK